MSTRYKDKIETYLSDEDTFSIAINGNSMYYTDATFYSNKKRYENLKKKENLVQQKPFPFLTLNHNLFPGIQ